MNKKNISILICIVVLQINFLHAQVKSFQPKIRIDTFIFSKNKIVVHSIIDSVLKELKDIYGSNFVEDKSGYALMRLKGFNKELSNQIFSKVSYMTTSFIERYEPTDDFDYMGIYELQFPSAKIADLAIRKLHLYNDFMSKTEYPRFKDLVYVRANDKIFIIENPLAEANKVLKCELFEAIKKHVIIDDFEQRKNYINKKEEFFCW